MDTWTAKRLEALLRGYISEKIPPSMRTAVRIVYRLEADRVTLTEERPESPREGWTGKDLAQFRLERGAWSVYAKQGEGPEEWVAARSIEPRMDFEDQLEQFELDREGLFWK
ncbi:MULTISPECIES: DUF3024 domain-containing protein [Saccharibacillus]|uniref:DUF3024 domain-containing protein n=1 Tax=Saccharibacillus brassicae TaxID=2583377 RepID=A0A4Y6URD4_SACBS|nr:MULTISPECIES: DUF3024 domain-containing protein [Saccharibacillus]MWJ31545.1 hypothetical protein [Saccharibacillus sp. WB 17]QDH20212.1 hypothetical protein FFV09_04670 [Saccharibacillus brassicae]